MPVMRGMQYPPHFFEEVATTGEFGPFMQALLPRQRAFIIAYFTAGDGNARAAAKAAGYADNGGASLRVHAHSLLHSPKIQAAMHEYARTRLQANVPAYLREVHHLATDRTAAKPETRLKAALGGLSRAGLGPEFNINQNSTLTISFDEKLLELRRLAALAGDDPDKAVEGLLPPPGDPGVSDAEFEDVA
jgi:terminase small subunit-like protein